MATGRLYVDGFNQFTDGGRMTKFQEVRPVKQVLFPTHETTKEALEEARVLLPEGTHHNFMRAVMGYHNTLLKLKEEQDHADDQ